MLLLVIFCSWNHILELSFCFSSDALCCTLLVFCYFWPLLFQLALLSWHFWLSLGFCWLSYPVLLSSMVLPTADNHAACCLCCFLLWFCLLLITMLPAACCL